MSDLLLIFCFELSCKALEILSRKLNILLNALLVFHLVNQFFKIFLTNLHNYV